MKIIHVLIVSDSPAFSDGLKRLLLLEPQVAVLGEEMDVSRVTNLLKDLKPDVIIWADTGLRRNAVWDEIRLLAAAVRIKTLSLNLRNNEITIYQSGRKTVRGAEAVQDLIETVKEGFPSKQPASQVDNLNDWVVASAQPISQPV